MLKKIHTVIVIISCICFLPQFTASQTISELVQEGMINYHDGDYDTALEYFNKALRIKALIQRDIPIIIETDAALYDHESTIIVSGTVSTVKWIEL